MEYSQSNCYYLFGYRKAATPVLKKTVEDVHGILVRSAKGGREGGREGGSSC